MAPFRQFAFSHGAANSPPQFCLLKQETTLSNELCFTVMGSVIPIDRGSDINAYASIPKTRNLSIVRHNEDVVIGPEGHTVNKAVAEKAYPILMKAVNFTVRETYCMPF